MRNTFALFTIFLFVFANIIRIDGQSIPSPSGSALNFIIISDHGRNGYSNQKEVANMMATVALDYKIKFFVTGGDNFQLSGVQSVQDPLWMSCFENIYTHPSSHYEWYPALGNHDHGGSIQAQIDYSKISRRWKMPSNYYTIVKSKEGTDIRLLILDTLPLISGLSDTASDYSIQDAKKQLAWVDSVLAVAKEQWVVVVGHHPVYSAHPERGNSQVLVGYLNPILKKHNVDFFIGAHDHIFQHLKDPNSKIDYFVNTAGSDVRPSATNEMTVFAASSPGFSICSVTKTSLSMYFINIEGEAIYHYSREKR